MPLFRSLSAPLAALALLTSAVTTVTTVVAEVADGERELVRQLMDRALFDLAEQFCDRRLAGPVHVNERADWELILSECQQEHAWHMDEDSRYGMVSQSAQRITEFLRNNTPIAEKDILLRVRQIELMAAAGLMEEIVQSPLSNALPAPSVVSTTQPGQPIQKVSATAKFALDAVGQAELLAEALLKQIDAIRRDIDSDVVRLARERIRSALAQIMLTRSRLAPAGEKSELIIQANTMAEQLVRSVSDDSLRFRARLMLADLQLDQGDFPAFKLRYGNVSSAATSREEKASAAALKIRALLKQGQPSEALQEYLLASKEGLTLTQELQTIRLQSLLQLMELLSQLDESEQRMELEKKTADEFLQLKEKTLALTSGVWRQRCVRIISRFERVQQVGPNAAGELDQVALLVEAGDVKGAHRLLRSLVQRLENRDPGVTATILLQSGNLAVRLQDWSSASADLRDATGRFTDAKDVERAAAADLLRVYVIGQQWNSDPHAGATEEEYRVAIEEHLQRFARQPTAKKAREWRARLLRTTDPRRSAEELLELVASDAAEHNEAGMNSEAGLRRLNLLCLAGDHLLEALARESRAEPAETASDLNALMLRFLAATKTVDVPERIQRTVQLHVLTAQQAGLTLRDRLAAGTDWRAINVDARRLLAELAESVSQLQQGSLQGVSGETSESDMEMLIRHAMAICNELIILSSVRQLADFSEYQDSQKYLNDLSADERFRTTDHLIQQLSSTNEPVPGDAQLAAVLISLIAPPASPSETTDPLPMELRISRLRLLHRLGGVTRSTAEFDRSLNDLLHMTLTESQMASIAEIITQVPAAGGPRSANANATARKFWQSVAKRTKSGQEIWLEASLQLAILAEAAGDQKEAARILGVVSVLHPEWGTPVRKARADDLRIRLENPR